MKEDKLLSILLILCLALGMSGFIGLTVFAEVQSNLIKENTNWYIIQRDAGGHKWVSKPAGNDEAQPVDVSVDSVRNYVDGVDGDGIAKTTLESGAKLTIKLPKAPQESSKPERFLSISNGEGGGSVEIVEATEAVPATSSETGLYAMELEIYGAKGSDGGAGGAAVKLSGGLTVNVNDLCKINITGGNGGKGGKGGTGVDGNVTLTGGTLTITGGKGGEGISSISGAGGTGVDGDVTLTGGTLTVNGGSGCTGNADSYGGTGVTGTVTLAGGTLTVNGGDSGVTLGQAPAFGDGAKVIIKEGFAYTDGDGTTVYPAGTYTKSTTPSIDAFAGKTLALCEAKIGDTFYPTLKAAFARAQNNDTITLLRDVEQKTTLDLNHAASLSLDLNGRKLLFNSEQETNFMYFRCDNEYMATITGSGTIEAKGRNESGDATIPLWRFCRDGDANTGTLTILDDAAMMNISNIGGRPWAAFTNSITAAVLNEGVTKVGDLVFHYCMNLKTVTLPATVTSIKEDSSGLLPFNGCPKLEKIIVAAGNAAYSNNDGDGVLYTRDKTTLLFCPRGKTGTLTVPAEVTTLKKYSFNNADPKYNSMMSLSRIEFARTEPGTINKDSAFYSYNGDCVLVAPDGMLIDNHRQVLATDYKDGSTISFRAVTPWDELQDELNEGGTVTLTRSYDYTKDSYEINSWGGITSYYGKLIVPKGTALNLNGYTLAAAGFYGDGEFTVKGGTLNCTLLTNNATMGDPTNATYGTLTLDDATVTADQLLWFGGMALTESTLTVGNNGKNINVTWVQPESGAMLTMDTASSVTLPQQQETDGQWRLTDFQTSEDVAAAARQLGVFLPMDLTFETVRGMRMYGETQQPYYALAVKDSENEYPASVTFKIQDSVPAAVTGNTLTYSGQDQELVTVDESKLWGGTMYYALGTDEGTAPTTGWNTAIPERTDVGTCYVWYMAQGGATHLDSEPKFVLAYINPKTATVTALEQTVKEGETIQTGTAWATLTEAISKHTLNAVTLTAENGKIVPSAAKIQDAKGNDVTGNYAVTYTPATLTTLGKISHLVTFKVVNGSWDDGTNADKTVTLTGFAGDTLKLAAEQIPAVGNKPNDASKAGSWDVTPNPDTAITGATTYTYTYALKDAYLVTVTNDGHGTGSASPNTGYEGTEVTLTAYPAAGYKFKEWQVVSGGVTITDNKFNIGKANVVVKAVFEAQATGSHAGEAKILPGAPEIQCSNMQEVVESIIAAIQKGEMKGISEEVRQAVLQPNAQVLVLFISAPLSPDQIPAEDWAALEQLQKDAGYTGIAPFDIMLMLNVNGQDVAEVHETKIPVKFNVGIMENLLDKPRQFTLVNVHNGAAKILPTTRRGNSLDGESTEFSTYAIAYKDEEVRPIDPTKFDDVAVPSKSFTFKKIWQGDSETSIDFTLYKQGGTVYHHGFDKKIVSDMEWKYNAWFSEEAACYVIEQPIPGYQTEYVNVGVYEQITDRCCDGGTIINKKIPKTGDEEPLLLWAGMIALGVIGLGTALVIGKKRKARK